MSSQPKTHSKHRRTYDLRPLMSIHHRRLNALCIALLLAGVFLCSPLRSFGAPASQASFIGSSNQHDTVQAINMLSAVDHVLESNPDSARQLAEDALRISQRHLKEPLTDRERLSYLRIKGDALFGLGTIAHMLSGFEEAENYYLESIETHQHSGDKQTMAMAYNYLGRIHERSGDQDAFLVCLQSGLQLHREVADYVGIAMDLIGMASYLYRDGQTDSALASYEEAIAMMRGCNDSMRLSFGLSEYGHTLKRVGHTKEAIEVFFEALNIQGGKGYKDGQAKTYLALAHLYQQQGEEEQALSFLENAHNLGQELGSQDLVAKALTGKGRFYEKANDLEKALACYEEVLRIMRRVEAGPSVMAIALHRAGMVHKKLGHSIIALGYLEEALAMGRPNGLPDLISAQLYTIAQLQFEEGKLDKARKHATECFELSTATHLPSMIAKSAVLLAAIYEQLNDFAQALNFYKVSTRIQDSIQKAENAAFLAEKERGREVREVEYELSLKNEEIRRIEQEGAVRTRTWIGIAVALVSLLIIAVLSFVVFYQKRKNSELQLQATLLKSSKEISLLKRTIEDQLAGRTGNGKPAAYLGAALSNRELEVLRELCSGKTNKEISSALHISVNTVRTHLLNIYDKLAVKNRTQAVKKAVHLDLHLDRTAEPHPKG